MGKLTIPSSGGSDAKLEVWADEDFIFVGVWNSAGDYGAIALDHVAASKVANYLLKEANVLATRKTLKTLWPDGSLPLWLADAIMSGE